MYIFVTKLLICRNSYKNSVTELLRFGLVVAFMSYNGNCEETAWEPPKTEFSAELCVKSKYLSSFLKGLSTGKPNCNF